MQVSMQQLGEYFLQQLLGRGPCGDLYLAEHRFTRRSFIIKVLPEELCANREFYHRFETGVQAIAALDHPGILKVQNVASDQGLLYLVMEPLLDASGHSLSLDHYIHLQERSLEEEEVVTLLRQIAEALDYAHEQKGIVHGGLKPNNILISLEGDECHVKLTDFGLTRLIGEPFVLSRLCKQLSKNLVQASNLQGEQSQSRQFFNTMSFWSPEQQELDRQIDATTDSYAFGVLAHYLLVNQMPGKTIYPGLSDRWRSLISRCLQKCPTDRPWKLVDLLDQTLEYASHHVAPKPFLRPGEIVRPQLDADLGAVFHRDLSVSQYVPKKVEIYDVEPLLSEMAVISAGTYWRGSNGGARDETPRHPIAMSSFALDVHPVTNEQFVRFLQTMGGEKDSNNSDIIRLRDSRIKRNGGKLFIESGYARHPVVGVTWYGATAYAKWVGKRLPTEAEWEIAATGGQENVIFPTGEKIERSQANFFSSDTTAVMSYPPNSLGLYDLAGNVYEWCSDWYAYNYYDTSILEPENPQGPPQGVYRVLRGGCWKSLKEDLRCAHRHRNNPGAVNGTYGFRCAADVR